MIKYKHIYITVFISLFLAVLPFLYILKTSNGSYPKIPVEIVDDSIYYFTRAVDVFRGHPFVGNPYVLEHKDSVSALFFVSDWIWSTPLFLGFSIIATIFVNQLLWFVITSLLLYWIFYLFSVSKKFLPYCVSLVLICVYWYLARPVAMQIIFPIFLGFIISLFYFILGCKYINRFIWKLFLVLV